MRTRSQSRNQNRQQQQAPPVVVEPFNLEEPFDNPPVVNMAANGAGGAGPPPAGGGGLPVPDLRTMEELCQPSLDGRGGPIAPIAIQATTFGLKNDMIQQVQNSCPFRGPGDDANKHLDKFLHVTQSMKVNGVSDDALRLHLFPYSLQDHAAEWFDRLPRNSINSFDQMAKIFLRKYFPPSMVTNCWRDLYEKAPRRVANSLIENMTSPFFPPSRTTNLQNEISNFEQRFGESFHEAWDRYKDLLCACPHHGFTELHQLDTFYNALNPTDQDSLNSAAGGNLLERSTRDVLTIIENKSKVRNSRNKSIVSQVKSSDVNSSSSSDIAKLTHAVNQQTSVVTTAMTAILKQFQATPPPAFVKAVEEICVTCGGAHPYYQCLAADGNTFPEYRDNIQGYVAAAAGNYNQGNSGYRPPGVANQTRPPGFAQQNVQNNQNRFSQPQGYNRGNNFNQNANYQAPIQQNQSVPLSELEKIKKTNEANMKAMQNQINNVKNELRNEMQNSIQTSMSNQTNELKNMMASFFQMNTASTSGTGSLPSNTIANPKGELKAITTRSGLVLDGPSVPMPPPFINPEEDDVVEGEL
ncbi:reverse transcriptase domain-containing protein [Tanacetum coccineum]